MDRPPLAAHPPSLRPNIFQPGTPMLNLREFFFQKNCKGWTFFQDTGAQMILNSS
jgi:hypothetical protein